MKELSIEEKAKRYDEALKEAVIAHKDEDRHLKATLERIFPELKENWKEEVRKWLIEMVEEVRKANTTNAEHNGMCSEAIAWLEKQGEQKSIDDLSPQEAMDIAVAKCFEQGEQKSVSEVKTPEESLGIDSDTYNKIVDECIYGEQKPAWSEEDETGLINTIIMLKEGARLHFNKNDIAKAVDWLKSIKERYTWKPSDEQMHYLSWIANVKLGDSVVEQEVSKHLNELLEDLKKLKE